MRAEARGLHRGARRRARSTARKGPQRIAPHGDGAASGQRRQAPSWPPPGPNASSVTIRRSKASGSSQQQRTAARCFIGACGRGQSARGDQRAPAAETPTWPSANTSGCSDMIEQAARRCRARARIGARKKIAAHAATTQMRRHHHERHRASAIRKGRASCNALRDAHRGRTAGTTPSGAASTTTKYFAHNAAPMAKPSSSQWTRGRAAAPRGRRSRRAPTAAAGSRRGWNLAAVKWK